MIASPTVRRHLHFPDVTFNSFIYFTPVPAKTVSPNPSFFVVATRT